jgi:hypothetical protein
MKLNFYSVLIASNELMIYLKMTDENLGHFVKPKGCIFSCFYNAFDDYTSSISFYFRKKCSITILLRFRYQVYCSLLDVESIFKIKVEKIENTLEFCMHFFF